MHQQKTNFLDEPVINFFKRIGSADAKSLSGIWDSIVDVDSTNNFTSPEYLNTYIRQSTNNSEIALLNKFLTHRFEKRTEYNLEAQGVNATQYKLQKAIKNKARYDDSYEDVSKEKRLLLPKKT